MAKKKVKAKKQVLTEDELLAQALVPEDEQPYPIPENWVWVRFSKCLSKLESGKRPKGGVQGITEGVPSIGGEHLTYDGNFNFETIRYIPEQFAKGIEKGIIETEDILIVKDGATTGKAAFVDNNFPYSFAIVNEHVFKCKTNEVLIAKFGFYYIISHIGQNYINDCVRGAAQGGIISSFADKLLLPLPPLPEQQRIIEYIQSMFGKLDHAKELIQNALDSFETRKAAILHNAFTGELTAKWRKKNGLGMESWENIFLSECLEYMQNGISKRNGKDGVLTIVLRLANIDGNTINTDDFREIILNNDEISKYKLIKDDILLIRVNGSFVNVGKMIPIRTNASWTFCDHLIKCRFKDSKVLPLFMAYLSLTDSYRKYIETNIVSSAGQNTISQKTFERFFFLLPTLPEQREIVRILDSLLEKEQRARELCDVIAKIDMMKKAILARAFRGELGTNKPSEESAVRLLLTNHIYTI